MLVDDSWDALIKEKGYKAMESADKYVLKLFEFYFTMRGFSIDGIGRASKKEWLISITYQFFSDGCIIGCDDHKENATVFLMRYYNYPDIDDDFFLTTTTPGPMWLLGFAERIIYSLELSILPSISVRSKDYKRMLEDSVAYLKRIQKEREAGHHEVITGEIVKRIAEHNREKGFCPKYFSYNKTGKKEIKQSLLQLLAAAYSGDCPTNSDSILHKN